MRGKHSAKAFYIGISFGKEKKTMTNTIRLNVTCFCHNMQSDDTQCYIPIRDIGVCLASCYKDEIWDLRAKLDFFGSKGCIFRLACSHPEVTKDHVLTSAYL